MMNGKTLRGKKIWAIPVLNNFLNEGFENAEA